ncbi:hypothetical protein [Streptomyces sp. BH055]|uniref:hypothetical protein n=1 Tax=unclassified Streptomyces TaxID=2593676 RepID=UPI003BB637CC
MRRTDKDRARRRALADASITSLPALGPTLHHRLPSQRTRSAALATSHGSTETAPTGAER